MIPTFDRLDHAETKGCKGNPGGLMAGSYKHVANTVIEIVIGNVTVEKRNQYTLAHQ